MQRNVASVDVKNFFPSVTPQMVYLIWRDVAGFGPKPAALLTSSPPAISICRRARRRATH
jgi:hypothetical protein